MTDECGLSLKTTGKLDFNTVKQASLQRKFIGVHDRQTELVDTTTRPVPFMAPALTNIGQPRRNNVTQTILPPCARIIEEH